MKFNTLQSNPLYHWCTQQNMKQKLSRPIDFHLQYSSKLWGKWWKTQSADECRYGSFFLQKKDQGLDRLPGL